MPYFWRRGGSRTAPTRLAIPTCATAFPYAHDAQQPHRPSRRRRTRSGAGRFYDMVKVGAKGPRLVEWAERTRSHCRADNDTRPVGADGVLARVGAGELILECQPEDELWTRLNAALGCGGWGLSGGAAVGNLGGARG